MFIHIKEEMLILFVAVLIGNLAGNKLDNIDVIAEKMAAVTASNCRSQSRSNLELPVDSISHAPTTMALEKYVNKSMLVRMRNMALNRALFYSFIYQMTTTHEEFEGQPALLYHYLSAASNVISHDDDVSDMSLMFDVNCSYPNYYSYMAFNMTLNLFGVHSSRSRITPYVIEVTDPAVDLEYDYTSADSFLPYARQQSYWWPDTAGDHHMYKAFVKGTAFDFWGPPQYDERQGNGAKGDAVLMTNPYFDCGRTNSWKVTMTSAVVEKMVRYIPLFYKPKPRYVAVTAVDADFAKIDINQCPLSEGNAAPNMFAGTHKCRNTTSCEPVSGFGFRRGGYQCSCLPGFHYPRDQKGPFQGVDIEKVDSKELAKFNCLEITAKALKDLNNRNIRGKTEDSNMGDDPSNTMSPNTIEDAIAVLHSLLNVNSTNCIDMLPDQLRHSKHILSGFESQFKGQGQTAVRLANFISSFLQNVRKRSYHQTDQIIGDRLLTPLQLYGEVLATVMADSKLLAAGVYFEPNVFGEVFVSRYDPTWNVTRRTRFGPYAWRTHSEQEQIDIFNVTDMATIVTSNGGYHETPWYINTKQQWASVADRLNTYNVRATVRWSPKKNESAPFDESPLIYMAPDYEDGTWYDPEFDCDIFKSWHSTYAIPFFTYVDSRLKFSGVVAVKVNVSDYDINQCPSNDSGSVFSHTAKCHYGSQYCVPIQGEGFKFGSYRCECLPNYMPNDTKHSWFPGQLMEDEYEKKTKGELNRYDELVCIEIPVDAGDKDTGDKDDTSGTGTVTRQRKLALLAFVLILLSV